MERLAQEQTTGFGMNHYSVPLCFLLTSTSFKGFKHIFTSPSSVDKEPKATRSGNARIHGMTSVTIASLAYVATQVCHSLILCLPLLRYPMFQVRFALTSSAIFSRTDLTTDSERFYNSIIEFLEDPEENMEVQELLMWWNR